MRLVVALMSLALALGAPALAGCGGESQKEGGEHEAGEEAEQGQADALNKIPEADRTAFFQLATAIGALRARAAPVAVGTSAELSSAAPLRQARRQVARLHPVDPQLLRLREELMPVLARFERAPVSGEAAGRAAKAAIADADRIEAGLRAYSQRTPAIGGAIPD